MPQPRFGMTGPWCLGDTPCDMRSYWTYILTNTARNVMYVGVTNDLEKRVAQHRDGDGGVFTRCYKVHTLVYAEEHGQIEDAIAREKEIKGWRRSKKE